MEVFVSDPWFGLLAKPKQKIEEFLLLKNVDFKNAVIRRVGDGITYILKNDNLSFLFIVNEEGMELLDSIDFYRCRSAYFVDDIGDLPLPFNISKDDTGASLVAKFGEPLQKGGGFKEKINIWLRWEFLQVEIDNKSWEQGKDAKWVSLTIFKG
ncbi:hypothetical protein PACTADRAFT_34543 [Pachysolen tannophilus NRRL Y-2460]|uniref:Uncharacterized protein n=1 Tax=Pachysolen tannophilus NRRL Y-2460 TaxID=669874 RepID=A0A1E4TSR8_PACTA|nr:hypothetical protein PACTADRAFT_34543 [Pachysolen tannophilus NRRL Y-2460]